MQDWLKTFHGSNQAFPAVEIAVKAAVALALGLLIGFKRECALQQGAVRIPLNGSPARQDTGKTLRMASR